MASSKSAKNPYQWPNGSWHSISWADEQAQQQVNGAGYSPSQVATVNSIIKATGSSDPTSAQISQVIAAQTPAAQPTDPAAENAAVGAGYNVSLANSNAAYQQGQTAYTTGYNADGTLNTGNPYSQAALLQQHYQQAQLGTTNSLASQGQLYSGSLVNAQGANDQGYSQASNALRNQASNAYHTIGYNQATTYGQNAGTVNGDQFNALLHSVYGS